MAGPLQAGDPVPAIVGRNGRVEVEQGAGRYVLLAVADARSLESERAALLRLGAELDASARHLAAWLVVADAGPGLTVLPGWTVVADAGLTTAQRLGALAGGRVVPLVTLVDPRSRVAATFSGEALTAAVAEALAEVQRRLQP